jgi:hypothetical protein
MVIMDGQNKTIEELTAEEKWKSMYQNISQSWMMIIIMNSKKNMRNNLRAYFALSIERLEHMMLPDQHTLHERMHAEIVHVVLLVTLVVAQVVLVVW